MAFTVPTFNLLTDVWNAGHVPASDDPDFENVPCQLYLASRGTFDVQPCEMEVYTPPVWVRMSVDDIAIWISGQVWEVPAETGRYYRARFKERMHLGFPNQYLIIVVVQCDATGVPLVRDIEDAVPCTPPDPSMHSADGSGAIDGGVNGSGGAEQVSTEPHAADGSGEIDGSISGGGSAHYIPRSNSHALAGAGSIEGQCDGTGAAHSGEGPTGHTSDGAGEIDGDITGGGGAQNIP